jgi:hypothetical protein
VEFFYSDFFRHTACGNSERIRETVSPWIARRFVPTFLPTKLVPKSTTEIRNHIYYYLLPESPIQLVHYGIDHSCAIEDTVREVSIFARVTQICQSIRGEYTSLLLEQIKFQISLEFIALFAAYWAGRMTHCQASVEVLCHSTDEKLTIDILPLLSLVVEAPGLAITFLGLGRELMDEFYFEIGDCSDAMTEQEAHDRNILVGVCRANATWRKYVEGSLQSVVLHLPNNRCEHPEGLDPARDPGLQVVFSNKHKQLWMDGTHSFEELHHFKADTGLDGIQAMDVRVGLTSSMNKGRGKGLRTKEEEQAIRWLLGRSTRPPKGVKGLPKMMRELE